MEEENKKRNNSISTIIITIIAILIIIALAFFYYYFTSQPYPVANMPSAPVQTPPVKNVPVIPEAPPEVPTFSTEVINFISPAILPAEIKEGDCQINSIAQPYRLDAWKCAASKAIYDPCFSTVLTDVVYCKMNPIEAGKDFLIKLVKPLPTPLTPKNINSNWAWFVELKDGTFCSPYTGARPIINGQVAFYGCKSNIKGEQSVLMGDLKKDLIWKAEKSILTKSGLKWVLKYSEEVEVKTVWQ